MDARSETRQPENAQTHVHALREPDHLMRLTRLGAFHQSRLSFMRILLRRLKRENWTFTRPVWDIDDAGVGTAVLTATGPHRAYSLVAFAHDLPDDQRSDRVIAKAWDTTFTLFDGVPTSDDIDRLRQNVPHQEAGRISESELSLSRANRSNRLWQHVVDQLAQGQQPDRDQIAQVGYLMRTTAVYGSGKFGAADHETISSRPEFAAPFQVEMLNVYLIRTFVADLVEHMARAKGGEGAVPLAPDIRRMVGIGNSTGLGMAPFLVNHPALFHAWINARETALARVLALPECDDTARNVFSNVVSRAAISAQQWQTSHPLYVDRVKALREDFEKLIAHLEDDALQGNTPWAQLQDWSHENLTTEGQEQLISLMLEPYSELVDDLADTMSCDETSSFRIDGTVQLNAFKAQIEEWFSWALNIPHEKPNGHARFWYVSEAKLEPRLGERHEEPGGELEQPLGISRGICKLHEAVSQTAPDTTLAEFLLKHPEHRTSARRVQIAMRYAYSEIHDNLLDAEMLPINMLRCKLSFFGATKFDPRSDRWVRICMYQNAPYPDQLQDSGDDWVYPDLPDPAPHTAS